MSLYPTTIPKIITAGNTVEFAMRAYNTVGTELTSGASWAVYWVNSNASHQYTVSSSTQNDQGFFITAPYAVTSGWVAGEYSSSVYADDGVNRYPQTQASITIKPSLNSAVDGRSMARQILSAIDSAILGQATTNQLAMSIAGRSIQRMSMEDLLKAKAQFESLVRSEDNVQAIQDGKASSSSIVTRLI